MKINPKTYQTNETLLFPSNKLHSLEFLTQCVKFSGKKEMITCYHDNMKTLS
jgi:hypothetical protein